MDLKPVDLNDVHNAIEIRQMEIAKKIDFLCDIRNAVQKYQKTHKKINKRIIDVIENEIPLTLISLDKTDYHFNLRVWYMGKYDEAVIIDMGDGEWGHKVASYDKLYQEIEKALDYHKAEYDVLTTEKGLAQQVVILHNQIVELTTAQQKLGTDPGLFRWSHVLRDTVPTLKDLSRE